MSLFKTKTLTVTPRNTGSYVNGTWTETTASPYTIVGSWQPASPRTVASLPEGRRDTCTMTLYTESLLNTVQLSQNPDVVSFGGRSFEVYSRSDCQNLLKHYEYVMQEVAT